MNDVVFVICQQLNRAHRQKTHAVSVMVPGRAGGEGGGVGEGGGGGWGGVC